MARSDDEMISNSSLTILSNTTEILEKNPEPIATEPKEYMRDLMEMFQKTIS